MMENAIKGRKMVSFIAVLSIAYVLMCFLLFLFQRQMIYLPTSEVSVRDTAYTVLDTGEVRIKVWTLNPGKEKALIYFGGNAENVAYNIDDFRTLFADRTVYLVNYRGYGGSSGSPYEEGLYSDALFVYDHFIKQHSALSTMGRSIGGAVATYLASKRDVDKLILVTPFDSAVSVGKKLYRFFPMDLIVKERLDSAGRANKITTDTLIIVAANDRIIPYENTQNLIDSFKYREIEVVRLSDVGHNTVHHHPDYKKVIASFMR
ncbi:alpha/beta hydrolase [Sulfurovum sp. TSL6]|uniref:alpha/beta hydrolase n=1 Tax=Sulfurovum sp. TSL6 TaxID=2826995 RepID=UPI001CC4072B|nr:alpha/beta hydrolase [Sulfurovum sp. TSL6]